MHTLPTFFKKMTEYNLDREYSLDRLIVNVIKKDRNHVELAKEVAGEVRKTLLKCRSITEINNTPILVVEVRLEGQDKVENIGITYIIRDKEYDKTFKKEEFYRL